MVGQLVYSQDMRASVCLSKGFVLLPVAIESGHFPRSTIRGPYSIWQGKVLLEWTSSKYDLPGL